MGGAPPGGGGLGGGGMGASGGFGGTGGLPSGGGGTGGSSSCNSTTQGMACTAVWVTTKPCGACIASKCCTETNACFATVECSGLFECVATNCLNATDVNTCIASYCPGCATSASVTAFDAVNACADTLCQTECAATP